MAKEKESQIEKLKAKATLLGIDADKLADELAARAAAKLPFEELARKVADLIEPVLVDKIAVKLGADIGAKLDDIRQGLAEAGKGDTTALVEGVAKVILPVLNEKIAAASEAVFRTNSKALMDEINARMAANRETESNPNTAAHGQGGSLGLGDLLQVLIANADPISKLLAIFRPQPVNPDIALLVRGMTLGEKIGKGQMSMTDFARELVPGNPGGQNAPPK